MTSYEFPIEAGHILMFARAVGDPNPIYADANHAAASEVGSVIAPPTFVQAGAQFDPEYPLRPRIGEPWFGSGKEPTGVPRDPGSGGGGTTLHAEQHFEYLRPFGPGDVLTVTTNDGETWMKEGRRGGSMTFRERITEYRNSDGELVVRARTVGVRIAGSVGQG
jgi:N-terminal half of MaoC dehydratase